MVRTESLVAAFCALAAVLLAGGCTGGAAGSPADDLGDILVLTHSPGNGDELDVEDSLDGYNALNNPTVTNPGAVTVVFTNSLDLTSVINPDPSDPQGSRNVRLFYFDTMQGPFDPGKAVTPGVNPPGANVIIPATTVPASTHAPNDTLIIRPTGLSGGTPLPDGQYSVIVQTGVRGADGDGMKGREYFFFFRVGQDNLGPVVVKASPAPGERDVDPSSDLRITMSETVLASTVNSSTISITYQPAGASAPTQIPGNFYTDGGNGPGNNFPDAQLDSLGRPGFSGISPRNGVDIVFHPELDAFPVNMTAEDPFDFTCTMRTDPPRKGNRGFPLGQAITVTFVTQGVGVTDTAGNGVPAGSPNTSFTFETKPLPAPVFAPNNVGAVYYGDTVGVGVIDVDPGRTPYLVGPNPPRAPNSVVTDAQGKITRVPVADLTDMTTDTRPYSAFFTFVCDPRAFPNLAMANLYAASRSAGGGEVIVIDTFRMTPLGRFGATSPGGVAITAVGSSGRLCVSNFSANTVTVYDIGSVVWYSGQVTTQSQYIGAVTSGQTKLILTQEDFEAAFPAQKSDVSSPPGPPILGTIRTGISPTRVRITMLPNSLGIYDPNIPCYSPVGHVNTIIADINTGDNTADFTEPSNLGQSVAVEPDLKGVSLSSQPTDIAWAPFSPNVTGAYYFWIASVGGSVELFSTGYLANGPSVRPEASKNFAPNKIVSAITGLDQPAAVQWITSGNGVTGGQPGYTDAVLVAETGRNRLQQLAITSLYPSILFETINPNLAAGLGPVDVAGDPQQAYHFIACGPRFTTYYVANAGEGTVRTASYQGGIIGSRIPVPGVFLVASWWSR